MSAEPGDIVIWFISYELHEDDTQHLKDFEEKLENLGWHETILSGTKMKKCHKQDVNIINDTAKLFRTTFGEKSNMALIESKETRFNFNKGGQSI